MNLELALNDKTGKWEMQQTETPSQPGQLEAPHGILDNIPEFKLGPLPVGKAAQGAIVAGIGDVIGTLGARFLPANIGGNYQPALLKAAAIFALNLKPVRNFLGEKSVETGTVILAYEGLSSIFNVRAKVFGLLAPIAGSISGAASNAVASASTGGNQIVAQY